MNEMFDVTQYYIPVELGSYARRDRRPPLAASVPTVIFSSGRPRALMPSDGSP